MSSSNPKDTPSTIAITGPSGVLGRPSEDSSRLVMPSLGDEVRTTTRRAAFPGHSPTLETKFVEKAVAEVRAAIPPPLEDSIADQQAIASIEERRTVLAIRTAAANVSATEVRVRRNHLAKLRQPWSSRKRVATSLGLLCFAIPSAVVLAALLTLTMTTSTILPLVTILYGDGAEHYALAVAWWVSLPIALVFLGGQAVVVITSEGKVGWGTKSVFWAVDFMLAGGLWSFRSGVGVTGPSLGFALIELGVSAIVTAVILNTAARLGRDTDDREAYATGQAELAAAQLEHENNVATKREADQELHAQHATLEERVYKNAKREDLEQLAAATASIAYAVETAALINEAATLPDESPNETAQAYVASEERRLGLTNGHNGKK